MTETLEHLRTPLHLLATLALAGQAGTYFTWATGVMPGLARTEDRTFVEAMQQVNVAIVNPVFLATFVGAPVLAGIAVVAAAGRVGSIQNLSAVRADFEESWVRWNVVRVLTSAGALGSFAVALLRA